MPQINLLPWREELRKRRQKQFGMTAVIAVVLMLAVVAFANAFFILTVNQPSVDSSVPYSFVFSYRMGLGDFATDDFNS